MTNIISSHDVCIKYSGVPLFMIKVVLHIMWLLENGSMTDLELKVNITHYTDVAVTHLYDFVEYPEVSMIH